MSYEHFPLLNYEKDFKEPIHKEGSKKEQKMALKEISSLNSIVFHISKSAKMFDLRENYHKALKSLLLNENSNIKLTDYRKEYDFIAKLIFDELSRRRSGIRENTNRVNRQMKEYLKSKDSNEGKLIINCLFHLFLLKSLGYNEHIKYIQVNDIKQFLSEYNPSEGEETYIHSNISLYYLGKSEYVNNKNESDIELALSLLYYRIKIAQDNDKLKENRLEYYARQKILEERINVSSSESPTVQGRLVKMAVILKAISGDGLYIPETEKEKYISTFAKEYIRTQNNKQIRQIANNIEIKKWGIDLNAPLWALALIIFIIELVLIIVPESLNLLSNQSNYPVIRGIASCLGNPMTSVIINGIIFIILLLWRQTYINKRHPID